MEPHTADVRVRAWAPTREQCIAEAVAALVESFAEVAPGEPTEPVEFEVDAGPHDQLLADVLDEVIYTLDTTGRVPVSAHVTAVGDGGLRVRLQVTGPGRVEVIGPVPKAVTLHGLQLTGDASGWSCRAIIDV